MRRMFSSLRVLTAAAALFAASMSVAVMAQIPNPPEGLTVEGGSSVTPPSSGTGRAMFFDNFEYDASRSANPLSIFQQRGYANTKATNTGGNGAGGYLYTLQNSTRGSRVLAMESRPSTLPNQNGGEWSYSQTDYYLQLGGEGQPEVIPANAWIQFWTYATPDSRIGPGDKMLYVCRSSYPCQTPNWTWMLIWGRIAHQPASTEADYAPVGERYIGLTTESANNAAAFEGSWNAKKLNQNVNPMRMVNGRWYQIKMHMDVSGTQGIWEAWIRERGQSAWTKIADWRPGVTPNFTWPLSTAERRGFSTLRMPTTVNGQDGDSTTYMDDFAIARAEADLPQ